jgi:minor extracellular serine protease Vpr
MKNPSLSSGLFRRGTLTVALATFLTTLAFAQPPVDPVLSPSPLNEVLQTDSGLLELRDRQINVFVRFEQPSVAEFVISQQARGLSRPSGAQQRGHARALEVQQRNHRQQLERMGVDVVHEFRVAANGLQLRATPNQIRKIQQMPGVVSVHAVELHEPMNVDSVPWVGAVEAWADPGATGRDMVIAVIDTGIDYFHEGMGGSGNPQDFADNDPTVLDPTVFPNEKVIGGWDFAGTNYNAGDPNNNVPMPDPDPVDENFHGTHVAGSAAGWATDQVGYGVAPDALLYALKVFGVAGSTALTSAAIERALDPNQDGSTDDAVEVINMSLGSNFGDPNSVTTLTSQAAAELGVIVVSSAGNAGNVPYILGSPAVAPDGIAVAASVPGNRLSPVVQVTAPAQIADDYSAVEGSSPVRVADVAPLSGQIVPAEPLEACGPLDNPAAIAGNIALIIRGGCPFNDKHVNAQNAGATAVIVFNNAGAPIVMGGVTGATIPGLMISQADGELINPVAAVETVEATLDLAPNDDVADTITGFSSRGPGAGGSTFKPDVAAPGQSIVSHGFGTGTGAFTSSGTSMSAPHVAGLAAIMRELHPNLPATSIKAMIMNATETSYQDGVAGASVPFPITAQGTGVIRVDRAARLSSYAKPAGVSFGRLNPSAQAGVTRQIRIRNLSDEVRSFTIEHVPAQNPAGVEVRLLSGSPVVVAPNGQATVSVQLRLRPGQMSPDPGFFSQREADGWFIFDDGIDRLRVGYLGVVDPASRMTVRSGGPGAANVRNAGMASGVVQGFTLAGTGDEALNDGQTAIDSFGFRTVADQVHFGLATKAPWESMSALFVFIDVDLTFDGVPDFTLAAADLGAFVGGNDGRVVTAVLGGPIRFFANADLNDRVAVLPFLASDFLPPGQTAFNYTLEVLDRRNGTTGIQSGFIDLADEIGLSAPGFTLAAGESQQVEVSRPGEVLWLLPNDEAKDQARIQRVR